MENHNSTDEAMLLARRVDASLSKSKSKSKKRKKHNIPKPQNAEISEESVQHSPKKQRVEKNDSATLPSTTPVQDIIVYPYPVDSDDHCETPSEAYALIAPYLDYLAAKLNKNRETLQIYDPYFCEGTMAAEMSKLGFSNVYNRMEDFYAKIASNTLPEYDVLITNPPYSGDHFKKIYEFCFASDKPYFLLVPNFVYVKDYYTNLFSSCPPRKSQFFVVPSKRLAYLTPKGRRQAKSGKYTAPFRSFWYCNLGAKYNSSQCIDEATRNVSIPDAVTVKSTAHLPPEVLADSDPRKKKARNALKRAKHKNKKKDTKTSKPVT